VRLAYLQLALSMVLTGANVVVAKLLAEALPIALIIFLRCVIATAVLLPLARRLDGTLRVAPLMLGNLALQAVFGTAIYNASLLAGLRLTTALEGGLVLATMPAVVAIGGALLLREVMPGRRWMAVALAAGGMAALTLARVAADDGGSALGNLLVFVAVLGEAAYVLLARRLAGRVRVITATLWMQGFSALALAPFALPEIGAATALASPSLAALLVFHALTASVLSVLLWYAGLRRVPAGTAGIFTGFLPATAALVAIAVLGEAVTATHAVGFALMMGSVAVATWPRRGGGG
jgi:drug/metabolite transporter (DMT)-like permease